MIDANHLFRILSDFVGLVGMPGQAVRAAHGTVGTLVEGIIDTSTSIDTAGSEIAQGLQDIAHALNRLADAAELANKV